VIATDTTQPVLKKRVRGWLILIAGLAFMALMLVMVLGMLWCAYLSPPVPSARGQHVQRNGHTLTIDGNMNDALFEDVAKSLDQTPDRITKVSVNSRGGDPKPAYKILWLLEEQGQHEVVVETGNTCQSACVVLLLGDNTTYKVSDAGHLMFHGVWRRVGGEDCLACAAEDQVVNWFRRTFTAILSGIDWVFGTHWGRPTMHEWANYLATGLGDHLAACSPNPFTSRAPFYLSGADLEKYKQAGAAALPCPALQPEPVDGKDWCDCLPASMRSRS